MPVLPTELDGAPSKGGFKLNLYVYFQSWRNGQQPAPLCPALDHLVLRLQKEPQKDSGMSPLVSCLPSIFSLMMLFLTCGFFTREDDGQSPSSASSVRSDQAAFEKAPVSCKCHKSPMAWINKIHNGAKTKYTDRCRLQMVYGQFNVTWPNKSNIVTVVGNFYEEKNTAVVGGAASVLLPVLPTLRHISARKTASVTGKNL